MTDIEKFNASLAATNVKSLAILAQAMRDAQERYFRGHNRETLIESKSLETQLDAAISLVLNR